MKRFLSIATAVFLVMSLTACVSSSIDITKEPADVTAAGSNTSTNQQTEQNEPQDEQNEQPERTVRHQMLNLVRKQ